MSWPVKWAEGNAALVVEDEGTVEIVVDTVPAEPDVLMVKGGVDKISQESNISTNRSTYLVEGLWITQNSAQRTDRNYRKAIKVPRNHSLKPS